jgi:hypothetical protein
LIFSELEAFVNAVAAIRVDLEKGSESEEGSEMAPPKINPMMSYGQMA